MPDEPDDLVGEVVDIFWLDEDDTGIYLEGVVDHKLKAKGWYCIKYQDGSMEYMEEVDIRHYMLQKLINDNGKREKDDEETEPETDDEEQPAVKKAKTTEAEIGDGTVVV